VELTDAMLLEQSIALPLLKHVSRQTYAHYAIDARWQPLIDGLQLWHIWELGWPFADAREEIVQWLYADPPTSYPTLPILLPDSYAASCAIYQLREPSPLQMNLPLLCLEVSEETWYATTWRPHRPLTDLDQLITPALYGVNTPPFQATSEWAQTVALATVIEYAVATYGEESLPALVAALEQSTSWESLLASVYDVSVAEFEEGWQAYLAAWYGV